MYIACLMLVTRGELGTVELTDIVTIILTTKLRLYLKF